MDPKALYLLIAITNGGDVRTTHDIRGLEQCETIRSLALYGMTDQEIREAEDRDKRARRDAEARWAAEHKPRPATASDAERCQPLDVVYGSAYGCKLLPDGTALDVLPARSYSSEPFDPAKGEDMITVAGRYVKRYAGDAKTARCVPDEVSPIAR